MSVINGKGYLGASTFSSSPQATDLSLEVHALLRQYSRSKDVRVRDELVARHEQLVRYLAGRFVPGVVAATEDLVQVGYMGLLTAIDRYDPESGTAFVTYAVPTIAGVIMHYLRDHTWSVKAPRRLRELASRSRKHKEALELQLGRVPTTAEVAECLEVSEERLLQALEADSYYCPVSLDLQVASAPLHEMLGAPDPALREVEDRTWVTQMIEALPDRERQIIYERFVRDATQAEVARVMGISQMHVSRLERRALKRLRSWLT